MAVEERGCPRCGYDQTGAVDAWPRDHCPVTGICTECGLEFLWRDIFDPAHQSRRWFFEHARSWLGAAFVVTWLRSLWGGLMWRWIGMEHPVSRWRLRFFLAAAWVLTAAMSVGAIRGAEWAVTLVRRVVWPSGYVIPYPSDVFWFSWLTSCRSWREALPHILSPWTAVGLASVVMMPLAFTLLPQTLRRAKVKRSHLVRIFAYHTVTLPLVPAMVSGAAVVVGTIAYVDFDLQGTGAFMIGIGQWMMRNKTLVGILCVSVWLYAWWSAAARHYLKLPHARAVALSMTLIALGLGVGAIALVPGGLTWMVW